MANTRTHELARTTGKFWRRRVVFCRHEQILARHTAGLEHAAYLPEYQKPVEIYIVGDLTADHQGTYTHADI